MSLLHVHIRTQKETLRMVSIMRIVHLLYLDLSSLIPRREDSALHLLRDIR